MKTKTLKSNKGATEIHVLDDESKESFYKIARKIRKSKKAKIIKKTDGIHYLIWEFLISDQNVEFVHHDDIGNYFLIESDCAKVVINSIMREIYEM